MQIFTGIFKLFPGNLVRFVYLENNCETITI
jgi:hypothetical protein